VAADIRFVLHAAEGDPGVFAAHRVGDGLGDGGLADAGRPDEAENLPVDIRGKLAYRKQLKNPFLDLLKAVMVSVKELLCPSMSIRSVVSIFHGSARQVSR
jgi:hypothetical protein